MAQNNNVTVSSKCKSAEENTKMDVQVESENIPVMPPGYYFVPPPQIIILDYLVNKIMGVPLPYDMIRVRDGVQLLDPQQHRFADEFAHCLDNEAYYISNKAERKAGGGGTETSTIIKTTSGYWREKKKDIAISNKDGQIIGYKTRYIFCRDNNDETSWRMDEFTVNPETIPADARDQIRETIACRIRVKQPKEVEVPYCEDEEFEEEESEEDEDEE